MRESSRGQQSNPQTTHSGPEGQRESCQGKLTMVPMKITTQPLINASCLKSLGLGIFSAQFILSHYMTNACDVHWEKSEWINQYLLIHSFYNLFQSYFVPGMFQIFYINSQFISSPIKIATVSLTFRLWGRCLWNHKNRVCLLWKSHWEWVSRFPRGTNTESLN